MSTVSDLDLLLPYQQRLLATTADVVIYEKSRRIGISWAAAAQAVLTSAAALAAGGRDTLYVGYNFEMAREFIGDCASWAKTFNQAAGDVAEFLFPDPDDTHGDRAIQAFRIRFASGFEIVALSSRPRSLRGKQGFVIIDEAAFHDDLNELIKAALALLIWGGKVWIVSTHDGDDNPFNELVEDTRAGKTGYTLLRTTFAEAVEQGLYKRVCLRKREAWTAEAEAEWVAQIRSFYGDAAAEELDVIPRGGAGAYFTRAMLIGASDPEIPVLRLTCKPNFEQLPDAERQAFVDSWIATYLTPLLDKLDPNLEHGFGSDFGRNADLTVLWPYARQRNTSLRTPFLLELRRVPFREQERIFFFVGDRLPRFASAAMDARGNGQFLAEVAAQRYGATRIEQVMATAKFYLDAFPKLKAAVEDKTTTLPRDVDVIGDHRLVQVIKGVPQIPSNVRRRGADGHERHGDAAIAHLLAHYASEREVAPIEFHALGATRAGYGLTDW